VNLKDGTRGALFTIFTCALIRLTNTNQIGRGNSLQGVFVGSGTLPSSPRYLETAAIIMGVGTNFGVGGRRGEARRAESGGGVLGRGQLAPPHQLWRLRERCKFPQQGPGRSTSRRGFSCILSRQIAFPSISVRVAYSLHGRLGIRFF